MAREPITKTVMDHWVSGRVNAALRTLCEAVDALTVEHEPTVELALKPADPPLPASHDSEWTCRCGRPLVSGVNSRVCPRCQRVKHGCNCPSEAECAAVARAKQVLTAESVLAAAVRNFLADTACLNGPPVGVAMVVAEPAAIIKLRSALIAYEKAGAL